MSIFKRAILISVILCVSLSAFSANVPEAEAGRLEMIQEQIQDVRRQISSIISQMPMVQTPLQPSREINGEDTAQLKTDENPYNEVVKYGKDVKMNPGAMQRMTSKEKNYINQYRKTKEPLKRIGNGFSGSNTSEWKSYVSITNSQFAAANKYLKKGIDGTGMKLQLAHYPGNTSSYAIWNIPCCVSAEPNSYLDRVDKNGCWRFKDSKGANIIWSAIFSESEKGGYKLIDGKRVRAMMILFKTKKAGSPSGEWSTSWHLLKPEIYIEGEGYYTAGAYGGKPFLFSREASPFSTGGDSRIPRKYIKPGILEIDGQIEKWGMADRWGTWDGYDPYWAGIDTGYPKREIKLEKQTNKKASEITNALECVVGGYYWGPQGCY